MATVDLLPVVVGGVIGIAGSAVVATVAQIGQYFIAKANHRYTLDRMREEQTLKDKSALRERVRTGYRQLLQAAAALNGAAGPGSIKFPGETDEAHVKRLVATVNEPLQSLGAALADVRLEDEKLEVADLFGEMHRDFLAFMFGLIRAKEGENIDFAAYADRIQKNFDVLEPLMRKRLSNE